MRWLETAAAEAPSRSIALRRNGRSSFSHRATFNVLKRNNTGRTVHPEARNSRGRGFSSLPIPTM
jgi:hypothetical protein